jgi:xanthine dehydrogenase accessory factor
VVVAADGRFAGYVSGGCVEAAVAAEALLAMETGCDRMVSFGDGSPFLDIVLPCGGGITVAIHVLRSVDVIEHVLQSLEQRKVAGLKYTPERQTLTAIDPPDSAGVRNGDVHLVYRPVTRLILSGQTNETQSILRLAAASGYDCIVDDDSEPIGRLGLKIDPYTAVTLLHHDLDREEPVLDTALGSPAFYIGALGSTRTHGRRMKRLCASGWRGSDVERIKAPIGMFGPARDATTLALSVLADVAAARLITYP